MSQFHKICEESSNVVHIKWLCKANYKRKTLLLAEVEHCRNNWGNQKNFRAARPDSLRTIRMVRSTSGSSFMRQAWIDPKTLWPFELAWYRKVPPCRQLVSLHREKWLRIFVFFYGSLLKLLSEVLLAILSEAVVKLIELLALPGSLLRSQLSLVRRCHLCPPLLQRLQRHLHTQIWSHNALFLYSTPFSHLMPVVWW